MILPRFCRDFAGILPEFVLVVEGDTYLRGTQASTVDIVVGLIQEMSNWVGEVRSGQMGLDLGR